MKLGDVELDSIGFRQEKKNRMVFKIFLGLEIGLEINESSRMYRHKKKNRIKQYFLKALSIIVLKTFAINFAFAHGKLFKSAEIVV